MKTKASFALLVLNVLLFSFGFYYLTKTSEEMAAASRASKSVPISARERLKSARNRNSSIVPSSSATASKTVYVTNQFHWSHLESADYREYIANLRNVGCPESTIKDIIMADVMKLYAARRGQFYQNGREFKFWETNEKRKLNAKQLEEREKQLASIDKEIPAVLRELLGINYEREINRYFVDANEDERRLNFLSEEKRSRVLALRDEIEGLRERVLERAPDGNLSPEDREELRKIDEQRQAALAGILSAEEFDEFELRTSETAEQLREALIGFNPSEEEFRQLYILQKSTAGNEAQGAEIEAEILGKLGEARYAEYQRAKNPDYRSACLFTELYELPQTTAASIFEIKQIAEREKQSLLTNQAFPEDRRAEVLEAIRAETEKSLLEILGTKILMNYTQSAGKWVQELGSAN